MQGEALLLVDTSPDTTEVRPGSYYLVATPEGGVRLTEGAEAAGAPPGDVLGTVMFLCRPPSRDTPAATTSELLSV